MKRKLNSRSKRVGKVRVEVGTWDVVNGMDVVWRLRLWSVARSWVRLVCDGMGWHSVVAGGVCGWLCVSGCWAWMSICG